MTISHVALKNRNLFYYSSRGWKSKIKMLSALVSSEGSEEESETVKYSYNSVKNSH